MILDKVVGAHLLIFPCFCDYSLSLKTILFCDDRTVMTGRLVALPEDWDNNLSNQHSFVEGVFEPNCCG